MGESSAPNRRSSSSTRAAWALVSTIASLQNSIPVQAMTDRRHASRRAERLKSSAPAINESTFDSSRSSTSSFCSGMVRMRWEPFAPPARPGVPGCCR